MKYILLLLLAAVQLAEARSPRMANRTPVGDQFSISVALSLRPVTKKGFFNPILLARRTSDGDQRLFFWHELLDGTLSTWSGPHATLVTWFDQSPYSRHASQSDPQKQPVLVTDSLIVQNGGKIALRFDGASTQLIGVRRDWAITYSLSVSSRTSTGMPIAQLEDDSGSKGQFGYAAPYSWHTSYRLDSDPVPDAQATGIGRALRSGTGWDSTPLPEPGTHPQNELLDGYIQEILLWENNVHNPALIESLVKPHWNLN